MRSIFDRDLAIPRERDSNAETEAAGEADKKDSAQLRSKQLNGARTELLEDLKTGFQKLPVDVVKGVTSRDSESISQLRDLVSDLFDLKLNSK